MTDENKNIENNQEENQNRQECNKKWWKKLLGLNPIYSLKKLIIITFVITLLSFLFDIISKIIYIYYDNQYPLLIPRFAHSTVLLDNKNILIIGGKQISVNKADIMLNNAEIFDLNTNKSNFVDNKMFESRIKPSSILLKNGNVLVIGGNKGNTTSELYNSEKNIFEKYTNLHSKKNNISLTEINHNNIFIVDNYSREIELYNIEKNKYKKIGEMPKHYKINATKNTCVYFDNKIYMPYETMTLSSIRNNNEYYFLIYDLLMQNFSVLKNKSTSFNRKVCRENSIMNYNNILIDLCSNKNYLNIIKFDFNSNSFFDKISSFKSFGVIKYKILLLAKNKKILIYGGYNRTKPVKYNEYIFVYDISNNQLKKYKHPFLSELINNGAEIINDKEDNLYIVGGFLNICFKKIKLSNGVKKIKIWDIEND